MNTVAVIDFETTGISPGQGARATEVAIVLLEGDRIVDRYQSLMNAGVRIPSFITQLTGISNAMVAQAPPAEAVMREAARFVGDAPMVAHNAAFDRKFWMAELARAGLPAQQPYACTMLLARRLYPQVPNHKLGTLVDYHGLPRTGAAHRALADAEMAAQLWLQIGQDLQRRFALPRVDHALLLALQQCQRQEVGAFMSRHARA
jgi:DNA polymerase-3 subunit epsilon